jgi:hypothetical protein
MAIPRKQIGWSQESNLLWEISRQMEKLTGVAYNSGGGGGVQSVTGLDTDNTDPLNPVVEIAVDGTTITGTGTPGDPLVASTPYRSYVCLVTWDILNSQTILTELQNDGFTITLTQQSTGVFILEDTSGPFLQNKTFINIQQDNGAGNGNSGVVNNYIYRFQDDQIKIQVYDIDAVSGSETLVDILNYVSVEIRVYP